MLQNRKEIIRVSNNRRQIQISAATMVNPGSVKGWRGNGCQSKEIQAKLFIIIYSIIKLKVSQVRGKGRT